MQRAPYSLIPLESTFGVIKCWLDSFAKALVNFTSSCLLPILMLMSIICLKVEGGVVWRISGQFCCTLVRTALSFGVRMAKQ